MIRSIAFAVAACTTTSAMAAPKKRNAKVAFDRGVAAYQKGDFALASEALGASFRLETDAETLFAWAQAERQLDHCDRAIELFEKLLTLKMAAENKKAVQLKIDECRAVLAAQKPKEPEKPPVVVEPAKPAPPPAAAIQAPDPEPAVSSPAMPPVAARTDSRSPWWKDPLGDALVLGGVAGIAVGGVFLLSAYRADQDAQQNVFDFERYNDRAERDGRIGMIATIGGGVLLVGGIIRYATRGGGAERTTVSGWAAPGTGGVAAIGRF